eukprot:scaffold52776_cov18-Tisochrysis_lutea.AAC.2
MGFMWGGILRGKHEPDGPQRSCIAVSNAEAASAHANIDSFYNISSSSIPIALFLRSHVKSNDQVCRPISSGPCVMKICAHEL